MRRQRVYKNLALIGLVSLLFLNCSNQSKKLIGSWTSRDVDSDGVIIEGTTTYMEGGKVSYVGSIKNGAQEVPFVASGTWELKDGRIQTKIETSNLPQLIPNGFTIVEQIVSISDKELITKDADGETTVYTRGK